MSSSPIQSSTSNSPASGEQPKAEGPIVGQPVRVSAEQRERRRQQQMIRHQRNMRRITWAIVIGIVGVGVWQYRAHWLRNHTSIGLVDAGTGPLSAVTLKFFPVVFARWELAPPLELASLELTAADGFDVNVDATQIPDERAIVMWRAAGRGVGSKVVSLGGEPLRVELQDPVVTPGRVVTTSGVPLPSTGVRVLALAGSPRGPLLEEQVPNANGEFEFTGLAAETSFVTVRVVAPGYATTHADWHVGAERRQQIVVKPSEVIRGRVIDSGAGVDPASLRVVALSLPGVDASVAPDGSFELHGVPRVKRPQLLVHGLPDGITHERVRSLPGAKDVELTLEPQRIARGVVIDLATGNPVPRADVWHDDGPQGSVRTMTDENGVFELAGLSSSRVLVRASVTLSRRVLQETDDHGNQVTKSEVYSRSGSAQVLTGSENVDSLEVVLR